MKTLDAIMNRRSIKIYKKKAVSRDDLLTLIDMGRLAPTAGNLQEVQFILLTDKLTIRKLPSICMDQHWMSSVPAAIIVCSQPSQVGEWFGERGKHVFATQDAAAATQNILIAATDLGLGSCWVSGFDQEAVDDFFGLGGARVESIITIGYADEKLPKKDMRPHMGSVFFNSYGMNFSDPDMVNNDYSKIVERKIKETKIELEEQNLQDKAKQVVKDTHKKIKEFHKKYIVKK